MYGELNKCRESRWSHVSGLELADPEFSAQDPVELLLGADAYARLVLPGLRRGGSDEPIVQQTQLGWIILGAVGISNPSSVSSLQCSTVDDLNALVRRFGEQEELPRSPVPLSLEDKECEEHFVRTHGRDSSGRYIVTLPKRRELPSFSAIRRAASHMLEVMNHCFQPSKGCTKASCRNTSRLDTRLEFRRRQWASGCATYHITGS